VKSGFYIACSSEYIKQPCHGLRPAEFGLTKTVSELILTLVIPPARKAAEEI
jgi:hypothetical protein